MKRPLFLLALLLGSAAYWAVWLGLTAIIATIHGDCWAGTVHPETVQCATEKRWVVGIVMVFAASLWVAAIIGFLKEHWPSE
ncbi:MAG: hypothetical protein ABIS16_05930 [Sphingomicrobium sp.]